MHKKLMLLFLACISLFNTLRLGGQAPCGALVEVPGSPFATGAFPAGVAFSPLIGVNTLYAALANSAGNSVSVYSFNSTTGLFTPVTGSPFAAEFGSQSVAFSPLIGTNLFAAVANFGDNTVSAYTVNTVTGVFTQVAGSPFATGNTPFAVTFSPLVGSNLFAAVVNDFDNTISIYSVNTTTGAFTPVAGSPFVTGNAPQGVAFSPLVGTNLFVAATNLSDNTVSVYSVNTTNGFLTQVAGSPFGTAIEPTGIAFSPLIGSNTLFAANANFVGAGASVYSVNTGTGFFTQVTGSPFSSGSAPLSLAFSPLVGSDLFVTVANSFGNSLSVFNVNTSNGFLTAVPHSPFSTGVDPIFVAFSPLIGNNLFVATSNFSFGSSSVFALDFGPTAHNSAHHLCANQSFFGTLSATGSNGATIASFTLVTSPTHGAVTPPTASGSFTYTPTAGFSGSDNFTFTATDSGGCVSNSATVTFTVKPAPIAINAAFHTCINQSFSDSLTATCTGCTIADYAIITPPAHGTVTPLTGNGHFTYTPTADFVGVDSFIFIATDTVACVSNSATISITVNALPVANNASFNACANQPFSGILTSTCTSCTVTRYAIVTNSAHGTVSLTPTTGAFIYTSTVGFTGADSFTFNATDNFDCVSNTATATITVGSIIANSASFSICMNHSLSDSLTATGIEGPVVNYTIVTPPAQGTITSPTSAGAFTYTPNAGFTGTDSFTFTATDSVGCISPIGTVTITMANNPPTVTLTASATTIVVGQSVTLTATVTGGVPPYKLVWSDGVIQNNVTGTATRVVNPTTTASFSVVAIGANGCQSDPDSTITTQTSASSALSTAILAKYCHR